MITSKLTKKISSKPGQNGFSIMGMVIFIAVFGFAGIMASKCIPAWNEYMSVQKAIKTIETGGDMSLADARKTFDRAADVDRIESIKASDVVFTASGKGVTGKFDYESRVQLVGNASLVFRFTNN